MDYSLSTEAQSRLDQFKAYTVAHPILTQMKEALTHSILEPGGFAYILVYGPTGVGKSTLIRWIAQQMGVAPNGGSKPSRPVILVETPSPFSIAEWYANVLIALDEPIIEERVYHDIQATRTNQNRAKKGGEEAPELRRVVESALKLRKVQAILFDEAQHFMGHETTAEIKQKWNWLKSLANSTGILHVLAGPYDLLKIQDVSGQAIRRGTELHFPRYHQEDVDDRAAFQNTVFTLLTQAWIAVTAKSPSKEQLRPLVDEWAFYYERSLGMIGILKEWFIRSVSQAMHDGDKVLTLKQLKQQAPSAAKSRKYWWR